MITRNYRGLWHIPTVFQWQWLVFFLTYNQLTKLFNPTTQNAINRMNRMNFELHYPVRCGFSFFFSFTLCSFFFYHNYVILFKLQFVSTCLCLLLCSEDVSDIRLISISLPLIYTLYKWLDHLYRSMVKEENEVENTIIGL